MEDRNNEDRSLATKKPRQYEIELDNISRIDSYTLRNGMKKSEVVNMALKNFFKSASAKNIFALTAILLVTTQYVMAEGLDTVSLSGMVETIGGIFKIFGVLVGTAGLGYAILLGGWDWKDNQARALERIQGGVMCGFCGFSCWGLTKLILKAISWGF